jgi:hypothetical protein
MIPLEDFVCLQKEDDEYKVPKDAMLSLVPGQPDSEWTPEMWRTLLYIHPYQLRKTFNVEVYDLRLLSDQEYKDLMQKKREGLSLLVTLQENPNIAYSILDWHNRYFAHGCTGLAIENAELDPRMDDLHHIWAMDEDGWRHLPMIKVRAEHLFWKQSLIQE